MYGLDHARASIAREGRAVVVEGYTDVLVLHQAGITGCVASMGTALTARQVSELRSLCSTLLLAFDADAAGQEASVRGIELALEQGMEVRLVRLRTGSRSGGHRRRRPGRLPAGADRGAVASWPSAWSGC